MCGKKLNISLFSKKLVLLNLGKKKKKLRQNATSFYQTYEIMLQKNEIFV